VTAAELEAAQAEKLAELEARELEQEAAACGLSVAALLDVRAERYGDAAAPPELEYDADLEAAELEAYYPRAYVCPACGLEDCYC